MLVISVKYFYTFWLGLLNIIVHFIWMFFFYQPFNYLFLSLLPPLSQPNITLLLLPLLPVLVSERGIITVTLFLISISLTHLITSSLVAKRSADVNRSVVSTHVWFLLHIWGITPVKKNYKKKTNRITAQQVIRLAILYKPEYTDQGYPVC